MKRRRKKINGLRFIAYSMFAWLIIIPVFIFLIVSPSCSILLKKSPEKFMEIGKKYYDKKDYKKAYKNYTKAIESNPSLYLAYWERALVEINMDSLDKSIDDMGIYIESMRNKESIEDKRLLDKALCYRANIMFKNAYKSDACGDWEDACALNVTNYSCEQYRLHCK